jgi:hypothetical protein
MGFGCVPRIQEALSRHHQRAETRKQGFWQGSKRAIGAGPRLGVEAPLRNLKLTRLDIFATTA